jgi:4-amino-4-deoxy-L-arabinose transferase-like glycosyltransferase
LDPAEKPASATPSTTAKQLFWLLALALICLMPFANKAFHVDDTLFLRAAEHIQKHPGDFYGFTMNWFGTPMPMIRVFDNPPLTCYYLALVGSLAGWSEPVLHLAFLLPALAAVSGSFALARHYCARPLLAGLVAMLTPVFLISATSLMCDTMLLAFWVWALVWFERGLQRNDSFAFLGSGLLVGFALLTKFTGLALIPLMAAYGLVRQRRPGSWLVALVIPILFAGGYEWITHKLYGEGLLFTAASFASKDRTAVQGHLLEKGILGLGFAGGCFLPLLFYLPLLLSRRILLSGLCLFVPCLLLLPFMEHLKPLLWRTQDHLDWMTFFQIALFTLGGIWLLLLAGSDFWHHRDPVSLLLTLWILGIFVFAIALNWTVNGRSLLPIAPAVAILLARRMERQSVHSHFLQQLWPVSLPALLAAVISLSLTRADYNSANVARTAATELCARHKTAGHTLWFEGHWGFQYYMEKSGASPMDLSVPKLASGDLLVLPSNNSNVYPAPLDLVHLIDVLAYVPNPRYSTMNSSAGAGFYAAVLGPLPFAVGHIDPDHFYVFQVN